MRHHGLAVLGASLLLAGMLAACAAAAAPTSAPPATPGLADASGVITGWEECVEDPDPGPDARSDLAYAVCTRTLSDPRLSGEYKAHGRINTDAPLGTIWGAGTLTNDGGGWTCSELIIGKTENGVGTKENVCAGSGGYAGLTAYVHGITPDTASTFGLIAWIVETP